MMKIKRGVLVFLATGLPLLAISMSCATVPEDAPKVFFEARDSLDTADKNDVERSLPITMKTAKSEFDDSLVQYEDARKMRKDNLAQAEGEEVKSIDKATTARNLAHAANMLHSNIKEWDNSNLEMLAGNYSIPELLGKIEELKKQVAAAEAGAGTSPFAKLKDARFHGSVAFFDTGKRELDSNFEPVIDEVASLLKADDMLAVTLSGHADPRGSLAYNDQLGEDRAQAVANALINQGVAKERIKVQSMGKRYAHYKTGPAKLQLERRVDVTITAAPQNVPTN